MECIIGALFGVFIGMGIAGYMAVVEINKKNRKIANKQAMIEKQDIEIDNRDKLIARQRKQLTEIKEEVTTEQYGSVINLQNKIKSILFNEFSTTTNKK